ncbi:MAG: SDR family NAD(P)-dependent oxidoreductase [Chloroflexota bacterium]
MASTPQLPPQLSPMKQALLAVEGMQSKLAALERARSEPIAVVGIGCRFPGGADDPETFWRLLRDGVDAIREVPPERWDVEAYFDPDPDAAGKVSTRWAGFLEQVDRFDPQFFNIAPREATSIDPQQRLLLEVSWEALENAGLAPSSLSGSATGVFIGIASSDYSQLQIKANDPMRLDAYYGAGVAHSVASGRLSYVLGLQGPSLSVDTACSSSLVAVHLACQSLRGGECNLALAGGVNVILSPDNSIAFSRSRMLAPDGRCKTFDARADGFVEAEGCGVVALKRLSDAQMAGDRILAIIRGSAVNQDGPSSGLTAPNGVAQQAVIRTALANAGVAPAEIGYVEAHGTGTSLGDPIEVQALGAVLREGRPDNRPFLLGSVKTNVGHLEAAAGITGLIKVVLSLQHGEIPPHLHLRERNPFIPWQEIPALIPTAVTPWPESARRLAGVSAFGFSGTNAHVVLEAAPPRAEEEAAATPRAQLLVLSARSAPALKELVGRFDQQLRAGSGVCLADLCHTARVGRSHFEQRLGVVAASPAQLRERLGGYLGGEKVAGVWEGEVRGAESPRVAWLFPGQGTQYVGMGRGLYEREPVFREALRECEGLLRGQMREGLFAVLWPQAEGRHLLQQTLYAQPALFAVEYALARLWQAWGVRPALLLGHSLGEYVAACVGGVFDLATALRLVVARAQLMEDLPAGAMAAVRASEAQVQGALGPYGERVGLAAVNGEREVVLAGEPAALGELLSQLRAQGLVGRELGVGRGFHSPLVEPMLAQWAQVTAGVSYAPPRLRLLSGLTGQLVTGQEMSTGDYWVRQARQGVQFGRCLGVAKEQGIGVYLEVGPGRVLVGLGRAALGEGGQRWLGGLRGEAEEWAGVLGSLGGLYTAGVALDWEGYARTQGGRRVALPTYPFQRQRYWLAPTKQGPTSPLPVGASQSSALHPLLGRPLRSPLIKDIAFECQLGPEQPAFLAEHKVFDIIVVPAAAYLEMAVAAARNCGEPGPQVLEEVVILEALALPEGATRKVQLVVTREDGQQSVFRIFSEIGDGTPAADNWRLHVTGQFGGVAQDAGSPRAAVALEEVAARCREEMPPARYYEQLAARGLGLGPSFRGLLRIRRCEREALGEIVLPGPLGAEAASYGLHPVLLDAAVQLLGVAVDGAEVDALYVPISVERFVFYGGAGRRLWAHATVRPQQGAGRETLSGDVALCDESGRVVAAVSGISLKRADRDTILRAVQASGPKSAATGSTWEDWLYRVEWRPQTRPDDDRQVVASPAAAAPSLAALAKRAQGQLPSLADRHGLAMYDELLPAMEAVSYVYIVQALRELGWQPQTGQSFATETLADQLGIVERQRHLFARLLQVLEEERIIRRVGAQWQVERLPAATDAEAAWSGLRDNHPAGSAELTLLGRCGPHLAAALRGEADPLQLLFPGGSLAAAEGLYQDSPAARTYNALVGAVVGETLARLPQDRPLRVLEVGGGTGGTTAAVLAGLPADRVEYHFTDISPLFVARAQEKFAAYPNVHYRPLDVELDPVGEGFGAHKFDVIIAANIIHATADLRRTLGHISALLAPEGLLAMVEVTKPQRWVDVTFGLTEGWWKFTDTDLRRSSPLLTRERWLALLTELGFADAAVLPDDGPATGVLACQAIVLARAPRAAAPLAAPTSPDGRNNWLVFADRGGVGEELAEALRARGGECALVFSADGYRQRGEGCWELDAARPQHFTRLLQETARSQGPDCRGIVHLWSLDVAAPDAVAEPALDQLLGSGSVLHLVQALAESGSAQAAALWLVTRGAQPVGERPAVTGPAQAPLWGLAGTIALEHPEFNCVRVDLDPAAGARQSQTLLAEVLSPGVEDQIAFRDGVRYVARLTRWALAPATTEKAPLRLEIPSRGDLDNLQLRPLARRQPGPGEVEIRVLATGLNFKDVLNALGMYPGDPGLLGGECSGKVVALGPGVSGLAVGDEVVALASGCFGTFVTTRADFVVTKPARLTMEEAATVAIPFVTASYALQHLGEIRAGERVLIHAAAGGVGLAAVQLAQRAGAQVFATAGSEEKRAYLRSLGVHHVMDSRSLAFADEVMEVTEGRGVDLVLNSLAGAALTTSLSLLAVNGRFLELGKSGLLNPEQAAQLGRGIAYFAIDWGATAKDDAALIGSLLREAVAEIVEGRLNPLPLRSFALQDAVSAFRWMAQAKHIGKVVITQADAAAASDGIAVYPDATYLVTGGLGGLGLFVARWLAARGARYLLLMGRGAPSVEARSAIEEMQGMGVAVTVARADVSREEDVARVVAEASHSGRPVRGIIHAAGVLDDGVLLQQDWSRFLKVMAPKVEGGLHLHRLSQRMPLDFLVFFSSAAAIFGSPGQGNHAAASAFLDSLAYYRRACGLPALSVNWGPWAQAGAAVRHQVVERADTQGTGTIAPEQGLQALGRLMQSGATQTLVMPIQWPRFTQRYAQGKTPPLLADLSAEQTAGSAAKERSSQADWPRRLADAAPHKRRELLMAFVQEEAGRVLGVEPSGVRPNVPLSEMGLDSLMAVELRTRLGSSLGLPRSLPATLVFDYPTVEAIVDYLFREALSHLPAVPTAVRDPAPETAPATEGRNAADVLDAIEDLSDDDVDRLLADRMRS